MSPEVAVFLKAMLLGQQIAVGQPDMLDVARLAAQALTDLDRIIND